MERVRALLKEYKSTLVFLGLMVLFRTAVADWNNVPSGSMNPTIVEGDYIWVNKVAYDIHIPFSLISLKKLADPVRGDIVVFESSVADKRLVKRVVGLPGDRVSMRDNELSINGERLAYGGNSANDDIVEQLAHVAHLIRVDTPGGALSSFSDVIVPENMYLVLGDNRDNSADSRVIGFVPRKEIVGRTNRVVLSLNYDNYFLPRLARFGHQL